MALARVCVAAHHSLRAATLLRRGDTPGVVSVAYKQSVAQQLGLPEPPKRPLMPQARFIKDRLEETLKKFPGLSIQEAFSKTVDHWRTLSAAEKSKWTEDYGREREIYNRVYKAYVDKLSPSQLESIKALKKKLSEDKAKRLKRREKKKESEELGKPKYPGNAFFMYTSTLDRGSTSAKVFVKEAAASWHRLPEETQKLYRDKAKKQLDEYYDLLREWETKMAKKGRLDLVRTSQLGGELRESIREQKKQN